MKKLFSALNTFKRIESPYGAGVCKGLASELGVAPWKVRLVFYLMPMGLYIYLALWAFKPKREFLALPQSTQLVNQ